MLRDKRHQLARRQAARLQCAVDEDLDARVHRQLGLSDAHRAFARLGADLGAIVAHDGVVRVGGRSMVQLVLDHRLRLVVPKDLAHLGYGVHHFFDRLVLVRVVVREREQMGGSFPPTTFRLEEGVHACVRSFVPCVLTN